MTVTHVDEATAAQVGQPVEELDTPALLVDLDRLERNIQRWQDAVARHGVRLRPHIKTHKVPEIAQRQLAAGAAGIAAAKVTEAAPFHAAGARDIVIAYPIVGEEKWAHAAELAVDAKVTVNCDSEAGARGLSAAATARGVTIGIQLEVDTGMHRVGHAPSDVETIERIARLVQSLPGLELEGLTTHRGIFFAGAEGLTKEAAGHQEGQLLVDLAERLRADGIEVRELTAGGTITGRAVAEVPGVTEVRAGTYVFNDLMQIGFGSAGWDDLALSVLCTVVSRTHADRATIDAGSKTFAGDRGVVGAERGDIRGLAQAADVDAFVDRMSEEHGMVQLGDGARPEVGEKLRFWPVHACTCVNLSDELVGVRGGRVEVVWPVAARGKRR